MLGTVHGTIRHRLLVNYAADPAVVAGLLPHPFRPHVVRGHALVGICALHLDGLRPPHVPRRLGLGTDAAAHRVAVEWDGPSAPQRGVWILRRDSAQRLTSLIGGRAFPGVHGRAGFTVDDGPDGLHIAFTTSDGVGLDATARPSTGWSSTLFPTPEAASDLFVGGRMGWSHDRRGQVEGVDMAGPARAEPVDLTAHSTYFDEVLPRGSVRLDHGLLMRDAAVRWSSLEPPRTTASDPIVKGRA